ncbi:hypothetical protein HK103_006726 [Boothiomyces macroporosus]|uniref:BZIP domain-containing protein n=1 Tax=Boothiomyces macroporosus TaxID=261099 RepID=A0AAD5Y4F2_9FUNG|nr:hypothetical protein HK103_006726 [Boothiomyces macroporosus]
MNFNQANEWWTLIQNTPVPYAAAPIAHYPLSPNTTNSSDSEEDKIKVKIENLPTLAKKPSSAQPVLSAADKRQQRLIKNRQAADASRKRKREQMEALEARNKKLEEENKQLLDLVSKLQEVNGKLQKENEELRQGSALKNTDETLFTLNQSDPFLDNCKAENENDLFNDFVNLDPIEKESPPYPLDSNYKFGTVFTIFLFSIASFLLPSPTPTSQEVAFLSTPSPKIMSTTDLSTQLLPQTAVALWDTSAKAITPLSLNREDFMLSLNTLANINPPNAVMSIESIFAGQHNSIDGKLAVVPNSMNSEQPLIMLSPSIRVIPYEHHSLPTDPLRLSLLANIPSSGLGVSGEGGILRLDMEVFQATWLN